MRISLALSALLLLTACGEQNIVKTLEGKLGETRFVTVGDPNELNFSVPNQISGKGGLVFDKPIGSTTSKNRYRMRTLLPAHDSTATLSSHSNGVLAYGINVRLRRADEAKPGLPTTTRIYASVYYNNFPDLKKSPAPKEQVLEGIKADEPFTLYIQVDNRGKELPRPIPNEPNLEFADGPARDRVLIFSTEADDDPERALFNSSEVYPEEEFRGRFDYWGFRIENGTLFSESQYLEPKADRE